MNVTEVLKLSEKFARALATAQNGIDVLNPSVTDAQLRQAIQGFRFRRGSDPLVSAALDGVVLDRATPAELEAVRERMTPAVLAFFKTTIGDLLSDPPIASV